LHIFSEDCNIYDLDKGCEFCSETLEPCEIDEHRNENCICEKCNLSNLDPNCEKCSGTYNVRCSACKSGFELKNKKCIQCEIGSYSDDGKICKTCPDGTYNDKKAQEAA